MERMDRDMPFLLQYEHVAWFEKGKVRILDRRVYPTEVRFVVCTDYHEVVQAIADMVTQSAGPYTAVGMGMALAAVTDNGNGLVFEKIQVRVLFIEGFHVLSLTGNSKHSENTAQRGPSQNHLRACA